MEVSGKIIFKLPLQSGTSQAGRQWKKQEYVLETHDSFPKKVKFDFFGDRVDQFPLEIGDEITLSYDIESREYNGRWYTDIRGWKADKAGAPAPAAPAAPAAAAPAPGFGPQQPAPGFNQQPAPMPQGDAFSGAPAGSSDDLPF